MGSESCCYLRKECADKGHSKAQVRRPTRSKLQGGCGSQGPGAPGAESGGEARFRVQGWTTRHHRSQMGEQRTARPRILITGPAAVLRAGWRRAREEGQFGLLFLQSRQDNMMRVEAVKNLSDLEVFECRGNRTHCRTKYGVERGSPRLGPEQLGGEAVAILGMDVWETQLWGGRVQYEPPIRHSVGHSSIWSPPPFHVSSRL